MNGGQIGNVDLVKQLNSAAVYRLIDQQGPISRIQVADVSQLAPASVTKITRQLLERGLIKEVAQQASTGGRRAISLTTEVEPFHSIAIRLGRDYIQLSLFNLGGKELASEYQEFFYTTQEELKSLYQQENSDFDEFFTSITSRVQTYQKQLIEGSTEDFVISRTYTGKPSRIYRTEILEKWNNANLSTLPMPLQFVLFDDFVWSAESSKKYELMNNPAGQISGMVKEVKSAREIVKDLVAGFELI